MAKSYIKLWDSYESYFEQFSDAEVGRLVRAMMNYKLRGVEPEFSGSERFIWPAIKRELNEDAVYTEKKAASGKAGGKASRSKDKQTEANESTLKQNEAGLRTKDKGLRKRSSSSSDETMTSNYITEEYEKSIGKLTEKQADELMSFVRFFGDEVPLAVIAKCSDLGGKSWAYVRKALEEAKSLGCKTAEEYNKLCPIGSGRAMRVDREKPSGNDFLKNATHRKSLKKNVVM